MHFTHFCIAIYFIDITIVILSERHNKGSLANASLVEDRETSVESKLHSSENMLDRIKCAKYGANPLIFRGTTRLVRCDPCSLN